MTQEKTDLQVFLIAPSHEIEEQSHKIVLKRNDGEIITSGESAPLDQPATMVSATSGRILIAFPEAIVPGALTANHIYALTDLSINEVQDHKSLENPLSKLTEKPDNPK